MRWREKRALWLGSTRKHSRESSTSRLLYTLPCSHGKNMFQNAYGAIWPSPLRDHGSLVCSRRLKCPLPAKLPSQHYLACTSSFFDRYSSKRQASAALSRSQDAEKVKMWVFSHRSSSDFFDLRSPPKNFSCSKFFWPKNFLNVRMP